MWGWISLLRNDAGKKDWYRNTCPSNGGSNSQRLRRHRILRWCDHYRRYLENVPGGLFCGEIFFYTEAEAQFYLDRSFNLPKRCPKCRKARKKFQQKQNRKKRGLIGGRHPDSPREPREYHPMSRWHGTALKSNIRHMVVGKHDTFIPKHKPVFNIVRGGGCSGNKQPRNKTVNTSRPVF